MRLDEKKGSPRIKTWHITYKQALALQITTRFSLVNTEHSALYVNTELYTHVHIILSFTAVVTCLATLGDQTRESA